MAVRHDTRKLGKSGRSRIVTLPADWLEQHEIGEENVGLHMLYNDVILILPPSFPLDKRTELEKKILELEGKANSEEAE